MRLYPFFSSHFTYCCPIFSSCPSWIYKIPNIAHLFVMLVWYARSRFLLFRVRILASFARCVNIACKMDSTGVDTFLLGVVCEVDAIMHIIET